MATSIPQKNDFDKANTREKYSLLSRRIAVGVSLGAAVISITTFKSEIIDCVMAVLTLVCTILMYYFSGSAKVAYKKAEMTRRDGLIDDSFGTKYADISSKGYYDTEEVKLGTNKLLSNIHENSFFSSKIIEQMLRDQEPKMIVSVIIIIIVMLLNVSGTKFVVALLDIFLSLEYVHNFFALKSLEKDCLDVQEKCKDIWEQYEDAKNNFSVELTGKVIHALMKYETSLSYTSIMLDTKAFNKIKSKTELDWKKIKERYQMQ